MSTCLLCVTACSQVTFHNNATAQACQVGSYTKKDLQRLKGANFEGLSNQEINDIALAFSDCVGNPDPQIRDGIVFEGLSYLVRNKKLSNETMTVLSTDMLEALNGPEDSGGYLKPFAALNLAELVRADRVDLYLTDLQRAELVTATVKYMSGISDYRGYDDVDGWRHGVAHTSDLALQFVLTDQIIEPQLRALRGAIAKQVSPDSEHAYIHGESERLARPVLYMARRGIISQADWDSWFVTLSDPSPFAEWGEVFTSEKGLAKLHNTKAFLNAVYVNASASANDNVRMLETSALEALKELP